MKIVLLLELPLLSIINIKFMYSFPDYCDYDLVQYIYIYIDFEFCKSYHSHLALVQDHMSPSSTSQHQDKGRRIWWPTGLDKLTVPTTSVMMCDPKPFEFFIKVPVSMTEEIFGLLHNDDGTLWGWDDHCWLELLATSDTLSKDRSFIIQYGYHYPNRFTVDTIVAYI